MISRAFFSLIITLFFSIGINSQYISVDTNYTADQLVRDIFFGNQSASCISVNNVTVNGYDFGGGNKSYGYFNRNGSSFEMNDGIILSTGSALEAVGPNSFIQTERRTDPFAERGWGGDTDLINTLNQAGLDSDNILNATVLEFDFVSLKSTAVSFEYMFLSEEYRVNNCQYSDAFAFLIKKADNSTQYENIAVIPGTQTPVSTLTINAATNCPQNIDYFGSFNGVQTPTNFNGQTKTLTAKSTIELGVTYHIKLVIADHGDTTGLFDSAVFLKAGSFLGTKNLGSDRLLSNGTALCENSTLTLNAATAGATYQWYQDGNLITGATSAQYTVTTEGLYEVYIDDAGCKQRGSIKIEYAVKPIVQEKSFCNYNNGSPISVNLQQLNPEIISNYKDYFDVKYYQDAGYTTLLNDDFTYTNDTTIYVSVKSGSCTVANEEVHLNTPIKSLLLNNQTICENAITQLETEPTYQYYKWFQADGSIIDEGSTANIINNVSVGKYSVELTSTNGCKLTQEVEVFAAELPKITNIDITGSTATIFVAGGTPPYEYSLDNITFQSSNIFTNIPRGLHKAYVRDAINCEIIEKEFLIINLINVITPNGDGQNDIVDYSDLSIKKDVKIEVYDRFGKRVFQSKSNQFIWDGKMNGRPLSTGTYWYLLTWVEPDTDLPVSYTGWILLKNRN